MIRFLWDMLYFLGGEGSWKLRPHERIVLEAAIDFLPENAQALLRSQLSETTFVQRSHKQISHPRFYTGFYRLDRRGIEDLEYSHKVIDVQIDVEGAKQIANVEFFQGCVGIITFKRPAAYYAGKALKVMGVRPGKLGRTHAAALDRLEHGKQH